MTQPTHVSQIPTARPAQLDQLVMARLARRLTEPDFQEALRNGDNSPFLREIHDMFADDAFVDAAFPGATAEQIAEVRSQMSDEKIVGTSIRSALEGVRSQQIDKLFLDAVKLSMRAPNYRTLFVSDLAWRILPPLMLGQYQFILDEKGNTVALVTWARLNAQVARRLENPLTFRLQDREWQSGDVIRIIDVISPLGQEEALARQTLEKLDAAQAEAA